MRGSLRLLTISLALVACGDNLPGTPSGPFDSLPIDGDFTVGLSAPVHVARDRYGIAHINAANVTDAAFVQGYVMAHDRLAQMDILRRYGAGTLSELFGALDPSVIDTDLEMRVHRMKPLAEQTWAMLQASSDPTDVEVVTLLQRFADGVNAYATALNAGAWDIDPQVGTSFDPARFVAWTPVDSLVLGRFQAFSLSWSTPFELDLTELYQKLRATYDLAAPADAANYARAGISRDWTTITPVGNRSTIDGFPNISPDTGTRSDSGRPGRRSTRAAAAPNSSTRAPYVATGATPGPHRPTVPQSLFDAARTFFHRDIHDGPLGALGPHAFGHPYAGSNNWAVSPMLTGGMAMLATDQHLQLPNPSIFYPTHLIIGTGSDALDVLGVTFPGIPGVILGSNGSLAWAATVSEHDVNDVYLETIAPCTTGSGDCVTYNGAQVPLRTFTETINIGALGTITSSIQATYEVVPQHGPIIPAIANHAIVPRTASSAMSVRYTGYDPTFEIRALWNMCHAKTVDAGFKALVDFTYGSQNWTMIDNNGDIAWSSNALVPTRPAAAYAWDAQTNPDGMAPFFVLPGDGTAEWTGRLDSRYVPHSIDPAQGYLATANADPVGATFDNNALNQVTADGTPLYVGITYASGVREERISTLLDQAAAQGPITLDQLATIQRDTHSNIGAKMLPPVLAALARLDSPTGAPADLAPYLAGLPTADAAKLATARTLLGAWTFATPAAVTDAPTTAELNDSASTTLFNVWMHYFITRALSDELTAVNFNIWDLDDNQLIRIVYALLTQPQTFVTDTATGEPVLCDDVTTAGDDSCTKVILESLVDAVTYLESPAGYGSSTPTDWAWGKKHTLTITPLFPNSALNLPAPTDANPNGFPKNGDNFVINRADQGWSDLDFSQYADGPAQRFLAEVAPGGTIAVKWALPGGTIYDSRSPHYRDLLDNYYLPELQFNAPYAIADIVANGESRWVFQ